jgi:hypothetical protein
MDWMADLGSVVSAVAALVTLAGQYKKRFCSA